MGVCVCVYCAQFVRQFYDTKELCQGRQCESGCRAAECLTVAVKTNRSSPLWKNLTLWKWQLWQSWEPIHVEFPNCVAFGRVGKWQRGKITWVYLQWDTYIRFTQFVRDWATHVLVCILTLNTVARTCKAPSGLMWAFYLCVRGGPSREDPSEVLLVNFNLFLGSSRQLSTVQHSKTS